MEILDIYDRNHLKTGKFKFRNDKSIKSGEYHLVIHACIFNKNNELLIQQRQPFKEGFSNLWDLTVGGSAIKGEDSFTALKREVFEEIGYKIEINPIRPYLTMDYDGGFDDIYIFHFDIDINKLKLQQEEVKQVRFATKEEVLDLIRKNEFVPYKEELINLIFAFLDNTRGGFDEKKFK
ncbi:MAG: NUDIX domain-containing protein [Bacilli bacterium]